MSEIIDRRRFMAALAAAGPALWASHALAAAGAASGFSRVSVDTRTLAARVGPAYAARVRRLMQPELAKVFADRIVGGRAPVFVMQVDSISLPAITGGYTDPGSETITGAGLVIADNRVLAERRLRAAHGAYAPVPQLPDLSDDMRLASLGAFYAGWLRREMNL